MTPNLIDSPSLRNAWIFRLHSMVTQCMQLETQISIAMQAYPSTSHALALMAADAQLGAAVAALGEAAARLARLEP